MDIELFEEFTMVAKHMNLSEAARELHSTESTLSRHIAAVEKMVGVPLFDRTTTPMTLTAAGEVFLPQACIIGNEFRRMQDIMDNIRHHLPYHVRIGGLQGTNAVVKVKAALDLVNVHSGVSPKVMLRRVVNTSHNSFDFLRDGAWDLAVEPMSSMISIHDLDWVELAKEPAIVLANQENALTQRAKLGLEDILQLHFVTPKSNDNYALRKFIQGICKDNGIAGSIPGYLSIFPADTYDELFLGGLDDRVVMLPQSLAMRYLAQPAYDLVAIPFEGEGCEYSLCAFYSKHASKTTMEFVEVLKQATRIGE